MNKKPLNPLVDDEPLRGTGVFRWLLLSLVAFLAMAAASWLLS